MSDSVLRRKAWITGHSISQRVTANGGAGGIPSLRIVVGVDQTSAGMCVLALVPTGGRYEDVRPLVTARWKEHPQTVEELVWIALRGLESWLKEQGEMPG